MAIIELKDITKQYGEEPNILKALDNINLTIDDGLTAIVGDSGSGKSTLFNIMGGLKRPTAGTVRINHTDLSIFNSEDLAIYRRRNIGFIFRNENLIPFLNVYENITLTLELDNKAIDHEYVEQIIFMLKLENKMYYYGSELSDGEQQKVAIARALATKPSIILADELTGDLDSRTSSEIMSLLRMTSREFNQAVIIITNNDKLTENVDLKVVIKDGRIEEVIEGGMFF